MGSKVETARPVRQLATTSRQNDMNKHGSAMIYPYSYQDLTETFPVKVEPLDELAPLDPEMMPLAQKNDEQTMANDPCPVSTMIFQEKIKAAPRSSYGLQPENSSRNRKKRFNLAGIPTKPRSLANSSSRPSNRRTFRFRSWNRPPQERNHAAVAYEPMRYVQDSPEKSPGGRTKKAMRSQKTEREVKIKGRLQL